MPRHKKSIQQFSYVATIATRYQHKMLCETRKDAIEAINFLKLQVPEAENIDAVGRMVTFYTADQLEKWDTQEYIPNSCFADRSRSFFNIDLIGSETLAV